MKLGVLDRNLNRNAIRRQKSRLKSIEMSTNRNQIRRQKSRLESTECQQKSDPSTEISIEVDRNVDYRNQIRRQKSAVCNDKM